MKSFLETLSHNFRIKAIIGFLLCAPAGNIAQSGLYPDADSLQNKGYDYLQQSFFKNRKDKARSENYAQLWLARAKAEQNHEQQSLAFKALAYTANNEKIAYVYLDSMVAAARQSGSDAVLGAAYLTKGISLYEDFEHQKALDNYLLADAYLSRTADQYQKAKVKYQIAQTKYQLGFYHEAIALLTSTAAYFESENDRAYLNA